MTQSKKWFHIGLWKEGMKQLRLIGFLSMLILALCAVFAGWCSIGAAKIILIHPFKQWIIQTILLFS